MPKPRFTRVSPRPGWVEEARGYGLGEYLEYTFAAGNPPVTTIIIYNGYQKSKTTWEEDSRV
jgi:hypothetical protein